MLPLWLKLGSIFTLGLAFFAGKMYFKIKDDSVIEEVMEEVIKERSGWDIDLTPESEENNSATDVLIAQEISRVINKTVDSI